MKIVQYQEKTFTLTNEEFAKALTAWKNNQSFWCIRIEALLPKFYRYAYTPQEDINRDVYLYFCETTKTMRKLFKQGDEYYQNDGAGKLRVIKLTKEIEESLINQEEYYKGKLYLE